MHRGEDMSPCAPFTAQCLRQPCVPLCRVHDAVRRRRAMPLSMAPRLRQSSGILSVNRRYRQGTAGATYDEPQLYSAHEARVRTRESHIGERLTRRKRLEFRARSPLLLCGPPSDRCGV